jgi:uncharacterized protein YxeA
MTTTITYYQGSKLVEIDIDKDEKIGGFTVTEGHLNLNNRLSNTEFEFIGSNVTRMKSLQKAVNVFRKKFDEYEMKSFDWKGHSAGCLKFYWNNGKIDVLTYLKLNYQGNEVMSFDFEKLGF